jgi:hypothetical protein
MLVPLSNYLSTLLICLSSSKVKTEMRHVARAEPTKLLPGSGADRREFHRCLGPTRGEKRCTSPESPRSSYYSRHCCKPAWPCPIHSSIVTSDRFIGAIRHQLRNSGIVSYFRPQLRDVEHYPFRYGFAETTQDVLLGREFTTLRI